MNLRQIEAFRTVMELGTVTKAAEFMHVSQPAVSRLLSYLEADCGFPLFARQSGRLLPTPEAKLFHAEIRRVFAGLADLTRIAGDIADLRYGDITLCTYPGFALRLLPDMLRPFLKRHDGVRLRLETRNSREVLESIAGGQADLGISAFALDHPGIRKLRRYRAKSVCLLPRGHRLAAKRRIKAEDLRDEDFISLGSEDRSRQPVDLVYDALGIQRRIVVEAHLAETVCNLVAGGLGVAVLDESSVLSHGGAGLTAVPFEPAIWFDIWLLLPADREPSLLTRQLIVTLDEEMKRLGLIRKAEAGLRREAGV